MDEKERDKEIDEQERARDWEKSYDTASDPMNPGISNAEKA